MPHHFIAVTLFALALCVSMPAQAGTLDTLQAGHPRILAHAEDFDRVASLIESDPYMRRWYAELQARGERMLDEPVARYELRDGRRLLYVSREVLSRVKTLGLLHRIEPDERYAKRIWTDLQSAAAFEHWNPDHFLDVAEMALAFALAYDWLHEQWSDEQRATMRDAMVKHAIKPGLAAHERGTWWTRTTINWNQVCHGGLIAASLAVADHEPKLAQRMIDLAVDALAAPMAQYAPSGGYEEGPGYWAFGTIYNIIAIAALDSALGTDFGLSDREGFGQTASFPVQMIGTSGAFFNFGDNRERVSASPALLWFGQQCFQHPGAKYFQGCISAKWMLERFGPSPLGMIWYDPNVIDVQYAPDLSAHYPSAGVAVMRDGWGSDASFVGVKGGRVGVGHSQMDLGSFVLDRDGVRWMIDLGADDYNLPGYFAADEGGKRWQYYRNRAEGHNTLVINPDRGGGQRYAVEAPLTTSEWSIQADLSAAYGHDVRRRWRHTTGSDGHTTLTDTIKLNEPGEVWWFGHTRATIELAEDGRSALLSQDGKQLRVRLVSPVDARLHVKDARPLQTSPDPPGQNPNSGATKVNTVKGSSFVQRGKLPRYAEPNPQASVRKLAIHLQDVTRARIEVVFEGAE
jgi:hypothetical protein